MQSVLSRIWTRVTVSISYDDNYYTTGTSFYGLFNADSRFDVQLQEFKCVFIIWPKKSLTF